MTKKGKSPLGETNRHLATDNDNKEKAKKKNSLRYCEYYDLQGIYDRLYSDSKEGKSFKNLMEIIVDERNIELAYRTIKANKGSKTRGSNKTTINDWKVIDNGKYVEYVKKRLQWYIPKPVREVQIPKSNGKVRILGIPTIEDRLIQQCIKQVLEPICEAKFYDYNFGFRPNRSTHHAIADFNAIINNNKMHYIVDVDIKGFFDNINHGKLLKQLWTMGIRDKKLICIISAMLKAGIMENETKEKGTPQGGILSPLLANVVLNEFDWWIANQWNEFKTRKKYKNWKDKNGVENRGAVFHILRESSKLKEVRLVRYADDFKLACRKHSDAEKIFIATKMWLKERLGLEVSEEKSKIVDIKREPSEFLGLSFKAIPRGKTKHGRIKYISSSHMLEKAIKKAEEKLKGRIIDIQHCPTTQQVNNYNATVLGLQNYYNIATMVNLDFNRIAYRINRVIKVRLRTISSRQRPPPKRLSVNKMGNIDPTKMLKLENDKDIKTNKAYFKYYKGYRYKRVSICGKYLFPIGAVKMKFHARFSQDICNYTDAGRKRIHQNLEQNVIKLVHYVMLHPINNRSTEYNDSRLSKLSEQNGKCFITGNSLTINEMESHHIIPKSKKGDDSYGNIIWISTNMHKLIHAQKDETIKKYMNNFQLNENQLKKLNKLRLSVENCIIER